ncbi:MAG: multidrug efflux RND transporter permease subunit, partial [Alphaproteobacteria bacterium]|nr:multidrug efflux RND transporter permease subunit [Alphaproteobacteria bacterium]
QVNVSAFYPGASAEAVATSVAAPLEQQINGAKGMLYMQSTASNDGQLNISVTFEVGTDVDDATIDVSNRVQAAQAKMPEDVKKNGITVRKRSSAILQVISMYSPSNSYDPVYISNYTLLNIIDELKRLQGVGDASLFGSKDYSMRIWFKPDKLAFYNLTVEDVANAISEQNSQYSAGQIGLEPINTKPQDFAYSLTTKGRLSDPKEFENIIIRADNKGNTLKIKDIARVELGAQDYNFNVNFNGSPAVAIGIYLQPGANALKTAESIKNKMEELKESFPDELAYSIPFDTTKFVEISIKEVITTFVEAIFLVVLVVYVFLQNARATLIPVIAVPVSIIGTFAGMYVLGFSINLLTLFGLVLAIGIVVDDAIVVLENVERIMKEEKVSSKVAAYKSMEEVAGPVVAIVLVLCAVFVPVGFIGGLTGEMYKQFAITISVSVVISGIVALTLTPALCTLILKSSHDLEPSPFFAKFNRVFDYMGIKYTEGVAFLLKRTGIGIALFAGIIFLGLGLFSRIPTSLVPEEDQGYNFMITVLMPGSSLSRTQAVTNQVDKNILSEPNATSIVTFSGFDLLTGSIKSSAGTSFIMLKDWDERKRPDQDSRNLVGKFMGMNAGIKDAMVIAFNPPPIMGMSTTGGFEFYLQDRMGGTTADLAAAAAKVVEEASKSQILTGIRSSLNISIPQYNITVDQVKAKALNVSIPSIFNSLRTALGGLYVNDFTLYGRAYKVNMQAEDIYRDQIEALKYLYVRSNDGNMIPVESLVTAERIIGPDLIERFNAFPATKIMGSASPGYSSGDAIQEIERIVKKTLPKGYAVSWTGSAYQEKIAGGSSSMAFVFGIIMVFLILAAQYENWKIPFSVIAAVPFGVFGALLAVWMRGLNNDVYFQIGLVTLIGLSAKNAILIVEFAVVNCKQGMDVIPSVVSAARQRFRPIVMTSLAFVLGCVPLAISSGAGSASRHSIGTGVIGGMLAATFIAIFFVPLFFKLIMKWNEKRQNA